MKRIIIFDFNRTIYDPDLDRLVPKARFVLRTLLRRGFALYLVSRAGASRKRLIRDLGITRYFTDIIVARGKRRRDFERIARKKHIDRRTSFVVGDRARKEIAIGNAIGFRTVWVRVGKFASELPQRANERPTYTVGELRKILWVVH